MHQKMTITIKEDLASPHVMKEDLNTAYKAMAADTDRENAALEWSNGLIGSVALKSSLDCNYKQKDQ